MKIKNLPCAAFVDLDSTHLAHAHCPRYCSLAIPSFPTYAMQRILCLLSGTPVSEAFPVEIGENEDVHDLEQTIMKHLRSSSKSSSIPSDLNLWSVNLTSLESKEPVELAAVNKILMVHGTPLKKYMPDSGKKLNWCIKVLIERIPGRYGIPKLSKPPSGTPSTTPSATPSTPRKIATMRVRNANAVAALRLSLAEMQIKGAKEFEIVQKPPETSDTKDDSPNKTEGAPIELARPKVLKMSPVLTKSTDAQKKTQNLTTTGDKPNENQNQTTTKDEDKDKDQDKDEDEDNFDVKLSLQSIVRKEMEALSLKHEESVATLRKELKELRRLCNRVEFTVVVVPRNKDEGFLWGTMIEKTTVDELEDAIYHQHPERGCKGQGTVLLMILHSNDKTHQPTQSAKQGTPLHGSELIRNDVHLRNILHQYQKTGRKTLTLSLETPDRLFTSFTFGHVVNLFQLTKEDDPIISDILCMVDMVAKVHDRTLQAESKRRLLDELDARIEFMSFTDMGQNVRDFVAPFLFQAGRVFKGELRIKSQRLVTGRYGQGTMDFVIEPPLKASSDTQSRGQPAHVFGVVTLVRNGDFPHAVAQNLLQLEASLRWRTISLSTRAKMAYGIVTDALDWYFVECSISPQDPLRPKFRVSALGFNRIRFNTQDDWKQDSGYILDLIITLFGRIQTEIREQGAQLGLEPPLLRSVH